MKIVVVMTLAGLTSAGFVGGEPAAVLSECPPMTSAALKALQTGASYHQPNSATVYKLTNPSQEKDLLRTIVKEKRPLTLIQHKLVSRHKKNHMHCTYKVRGKHSPQYLHVTVTTDINRLPSEIKRKIIEGDDGRSLKDLALINKDFSEDVRNTLMKRGVVLNMKRIAAEDDEAFIKFLQRHQNMESLEIKNYNHEIFKRALAALPEGVQFKKLRSFSLRSPFFRASYVKRLDRRFFARLPNLMSLNLGGNHIGDDSAIALANRPNLKNLKFLNLELNQIGPAGAQALAKSPHLKNLGTLNLGMNKIGDNGTIALANSPNLKNLKFLNLGLNQIGDDGAEALAKSPHLKNLEGLNLGLNNIGPAGAIALANSANLQNLMVLVLGLNHIGPAGTIALANSPNLKNLGTLDLAGNRIGAAGVQALAKSSYLASLEFLDLSKNEIGDVAFLQEVRNAFPRAEVRFF